jgi:hypothetical protein
MQMNLWKSGVTCRISPELMAAEAMPIQHTVLKMGDALYSCCGITSSCPTRLITWLQKQKLSLEQWTWKKYVQIHAEQHAVLNGLTDYGYSGIDNGTKVRTLMGGIKTDDLDTVKAAVMTSPALRTNYPHVVTLYGDFIKQQKIESSSINVSDAHTTCHHIGPVSVAGSDHDAHYDGVVDDRFYNHAKYRILSSHQKNELWLKLKHRGADDNIRRKGDGRRSNCKRVREAELKKDKKTIKSSTRTIAVLYCNTDDPESSSD